MSKDLWADGWTTIPNAVLFDKDLTPNAKLVFGFISSLSAKEGFCWATNSYIAEKMGLGLSTVSSLISELCKKKYILELDNLIVMLKLFIHC